MTSPSISTELKKKVEVLLFVHSRPVSTKELISIIGEPADKDSIELCLKQIGRELDLADKPYSLESLAGGWQMLTRSEFSPLLKKLNEVQKKETLSKAQLETLAVVAYSQPITKFDIESIRGVGCGPVLKVLQERDYIRVVGRADKLGAPVLYGTTKYFLNVFGLNDPQELPERDDIISTFKDKLHSHSQKQDAEKKRMPKRTDLKTILIIGSGPIVIGQACEFDYSGTQALKALKEEGFRIVLANSNPATIMTDPKMADATYIEPLTPEFLEKVIEIEKPDAILPTLGGQTALNLTIALDENGVLEKTQC